MGDHCKREHTTVVCSTTWIYRVPLCSGGELDGSAASGLNWASDCRSKYVATCEGVIAEIVLLRVAFLLLLVIASGGNFIVEQPRSSLLFRHERMQWLAGRLRVPRASS